jgi:hypothetical protein
MLGPHTTFSARAKRSRAAVPLHARGEYRRRVRDAAPLHDRFVDVGAAPSMVI